MKRLVATLMLARRVRPGGRFAIRQLRRVPGRYRYSLRGTRYSVFIRHDSDDPFVLDECFGRLRHYEFPGEVVAALGDGAGPLRVVDLGSNIGLFGLLALIRFPAAEVTGFEPDPANAELHQFCIEANELGDRWRLIRAFAATRAGEVPFLAGRSSRSRAAIEADAGRSGVGERARTVAVEAIDVFPHLEGADLIKIDIEGGEWELLADPRFAELEARAVVLEYHRNGCPGPDPRRAALEALTGAGYRSKVIHETPDTEDPFEGQGMAWGWRPRAVGRGSD